MNQDEIRELNKDCLGWEIAYKNEKKEHFLTKLGMVIFFIICLILTYLQIK